MLSFVDDVVLKLSIEWPRQRGHTPKLYEGNCEMTLFFRRLVDALLLGIRLILAFAVWSVGLLASAARTEPADDELSSSIRGGVLNYRTGKLDQGTDPGGLYDRD